MNIDQKSEKLNYYFEGSTLFFIDKLTLPAINFYSSRLLKELKKYPENELKIDLSKLTKLDSAGVVFLEHLKKICQENILMYFLAEPIKI